MNETLTALIEAADKATPLDARGEKYDIETRHLVSRSEMACYFAARNAIPALRASLARDAALEAFVREVEHEADILIADKYGTSSNPERHIALNWCADRLTQILEGRK